MAQNQEKQSDLSKVFGFLLVSAGFGIAIVYSAWVALCMVSPPPPSDLCAFTAMHEKRERAADRTGAEPIALAPAPSLGTRNWLNFDLPVRCQNREGHSREEAPISCTGEEKMNISLRLMVSKSL